MEMSRDDDGDPTWERNEQYENAYAVKRQEQRVDVFLSFGKMVPDEKQQSRVKHRSYERFANSNNRGLL